MRKIQAGGRPPKTNKRSKQISVKLTEAEYERLCSQAANGCLSTFIRHRLLGSAAPKIIPEVNRMIWHQHAETTANLNRMLRGKQPVSDEALRSALQALMQELAAIRSLLIGGHHGHR